MACLTQFLETRQVGDEPIRSLCRIAGDFRVVTSICRDQISVVRHISFKSAYNLSSYLSAPVRSNPTGLDWLPDFENRVVLLSLPYTLDVIFKVSLYFPSHHANSAGRFKIRGVAHGSGKTGIASPLGS